jgi:hypothetical protein
MDAKLKQLSKSQRVKESRSTKFKSGKFCRNFLFYGGAGGMGLHIAPYQVRETDFCYKSPIASYFLIEKEQEMKEKRNISYTMHIIFLIPP